MNNYTDLDNAERFINMYDGELIYRSATKTWYQPSSKGWGKAVIIANIRRFFEELLGEDQQSYRKILECQSYPNIGCMLNLVKEELALSEEEFHKLITEKTKER